MTSRPYPSFSHHHDHERHAHPHAQAALSRIRPIIPDLRFEQSYLKSINRYVHVSDSSGEEREALGKGKEKLEVVADAVCDEVQKGKGREVRVQIEWGRIMWVTTRDQIISPLLQGALWGVATHFLRPLLLGFGSQFRSYFGAVNLRTSLRSALGGVAFSSSGR